MLSAIKYWYTRYFSDPQAGILLIALALFFLIVLGLGKFLSPVFISIVLAYLLDWVVCGLTRCKIPRKLAVIIVFLVFLGLVALLIFDLIPLLIRQLRNLMDALPNVSLQIKTVLANHAHDLPYLSSDKFNNLLNSLRNDSLDILQRALSYSLSSIPSIISFVVYFVMVPLLLYFFLSDKKDILSWSTRYFVPKKQTVLTKVWKDLDKQIGNYVRGKILEALIVGVVSYIAFLILGLEYAPLLAALVGISVFVPYIGAIVVTIPIVIVGFIQWGFTPHYVYVLIVYTIILGLDATILSTLLFSGAVALHPIIIIIALLLFGGLFGFWGIFFAVPLASLCKAVFEHWPRTKVVQK